MCQPLPTWPWAVYSQVWPLQNEGSELPGSEVLCPQTHVQAGSGPRPWAARHGSGTPRRARVGPALNLLQTCRLILTRISSPAFLKLWIPQISVPGTMMRQHNVRVHLRHLCRGSRMLRHGMHHQERPLLKLAHTHLPRNSVCVGRCGCVHARVHTRLCARWRKGNSNGRDWKIFFYNLKRHWGSTTFQKYWTRRWNVTFIF